MRRNLLFYVSLTMWLIWLFQSQFFEIATAVTLIYFLITWEQEDSSQNTGKKNRKFGKIERIKTIAVPTEVKFKRKDGTILTLKAKKIIRDSQFTGSGNGGKDGK